MCELFLIKGKMYNKVIKLIKDKYDFHTRH